MKPNSIWETLTRSLRRFGDRGIVHRLLVRIGVREKLIYTRVTDWSALIAESETILSSLQNGEIQRWVDCDVCPYEWDPRIEGRFCPRCAEERAKQDPAVWSAADRARRGQ
jgi:hypothetical protein